MKIRYQLLFITLSVSLLLISCSNFPFGSNPGDFSLQGEENDDRPAGVILSGNGRIFKIVENDNEDEREPFIMENVDLPLSETGAVFPFGRGYLVINDRNQLILYNEQLEVVATRKTKPIRTLKVSFPFIYTASESSFIALDHNLKRLSRVKFVFPDIYGFEKNVHHIIIHDQVAYLLDNTVEPLLIFKVSIDNPRNMKLLWEYEYEGINAKLLTQWVEQEKYWAVLESQVFRTGDGHVFLQGISLFPLDHTSTNRDYYEIYSEEHTFSGTKIKGSLVHTDSATSPNWFIREKSGRFYLSSTVWSMGKIVFKDELELEFLKSDQLIEMAVNKNNLFIATTEMVTVIDLEYKPAVVYQANLDHYQLKWINPLQPLE